MDVRKLQKVGKSTFLVSLPKEWVIKNKLSQGDPVAIFETTDGNLIVDPKYTERDELKQVTIEIPKTKKINSGFDLGREITAAYLFGYDSISIGSEKNISPDEREIVKKSIQKLIGIEIVEETARKISLQCLLSTTALPLDKSLERTYRIAAQMHKDSITALIEGDEKLAKLVIERDDDVDRLYFLTVRQLRAAVQDPKIAKKMGVSPIECLDYRVIAKSIENLADLATDIADRTLKVKGLKLEPSIANLILEISNIALDMSAKAMEALKSHSMTLAIEVIEKCRPKILEKIDYTREQIERGKYGPWAVHIEAILDNLDRISEVSVDIADLIMRR
ncbi:MAG: PhoU domain-containing protein [Candidatus Helarchaeota archaeon]|mgnify:CR=1 FL=1